MQGSKFDILFSGELLSDEHPREVRRRLQRRFRLSEDGAARLFSGRTVTVKRGVDTATASRYRDIFQNAGALIEIHPVAVASPFPLPNGADPFRSPVSSGGEVEVAAEPNDSRLQRSLRDDEPLERPSAQGVPAIDTSYLSLVPGYDWTLEDCQPPLPPIKLPDTSHLKLVEFPAHVDGERRS